MKNAVVTGAAGGMGSAVCRLLEQQGFRVFGLDVKPVPAGTGILCDLTDSVSLENACREILASAGTVDAIVHTAGIYDLDSLVEIPEERFRRIFEINLFGAYRVNRVFTPHMAPGSRITFITSELAPLDPLPFTGIYAVTKAALEKYAYSLRSELMLRGISVSVLRPGAVQTGLLNASTAALDRFCSSTRYYQPNAARFYQIVNSVEARAVSPERIARLVLRSLTARHPRYVYCINRNPLLLLMNLLPDRLQTAVLRLILR